MTTARLLKVLEWLGACEDGLEWVVARTEPRQAWDECDDGWNLDWILRKIGEYDEAVAAWYSRTDHLYEEIDRNLGPRCGRSIAYGASSDAIRALGSYELLEAAIERFAVVSGLWDNGDPAGPPAGPASKIP